MIIEVHTREKPAVPGRAWLAAFLLLVVASALAAALSWGRAGDVLSARIEPPGWMISFRPPRRFETGEFGHTAFGQAYRFHGATPAGDATLAVYRVEGIDIDARALCDRLLQAHWGLDPPPVGMSRLTRLDTRLGPFRAVEIRDPLIGVVVRAAELGGAGAYAVSLAVQGAEIDRESYRLFDLTCASVEVHVD